MATALDNMGRQINDANMTLGEIKSLIATLMGKKVGSAKPVENSAPQNMGKLQALFETYIKDFNTEVKEQKGFLKEIVDTLKEVTGLKSSKAKESGGRGRIIEKNGKIIPSKEDKLAAKSSDKLAREFHKTLGTKGSGFTHDTHCEKLLEQILEALTGKGAKPPGGGGGGSGSVGGGEEDGGGGKTHNRQIKGWWLSGPSREELERVAIMNYLVNKIRSTSNALQKNFLGFNGFDTILKGVSDEERKFTQDVRATAYEVAGVTKESKGLQKIYEQIGSSYTQTGMDRSEFQKNYIKNLKHGIKDTKIALSVTKSQLNTERQIGVEAGTLNDTFLNMAKAGRMNTAQIAQMGRGMRDVARHTGLTGDALAEAVKSSEQFTTNLRKAANLTASSVENIMEISAHAQKLGIASEMQPLMNAMTSTNNLMFEASKGTQALLMQAAGSVGRIDDLMKGTITKSKSGIKDMAKGFDNVLKQFGVDSLDAVDNLSDESKMQLNMQLKAAYGIELGDMRSVIETMQEAGKGMADRLGDINKQRQLNLTTEERAALNEKERALKAGKSLSVLTALSEATKGTGSGVEGMTKALAKFDKRKDEFEGDMNAMGQTWSSSGDAARQSIESALNEINAGRSKAGMEAVKIDSSDIDAALKDKDALALVMDRLTKGEQELATANKDQLDPMTAMEGYLKDINDNIRVFTQSVFSSIFNSVLGELIAITGVLGSILVAVGSYGVEAYTGWESLKGTFDRLTGRNSGGGAAAGGAGAAAGAAAGGGPGGAGGPLVTAKTKFQEKLAAFGDSIEASTQGASKRILEATNKFSEKVKTDPIGAYTDLVKSVWKETGKVAKTASDYVGKKLKEGFKSFGDGLNLLKGRMSSFIGDIKQKIMDIDYKKYLNPKALLGYAQRAKAAIPAIASAVTSGLGTGLAGVVSVAGQAAAGVARFAASMNPIGLGIAAVMAAIGGLNGALKAGARAGEIFGKAQEEVTLNELYAAKSAGFLTGILNGLTLGLAGWLLPLDKITDAIARFNAKVPILTILLTPLIVVLEVLWGVIKGLGLAIWEVIKGIWDGVMNVINPIVDGLSAIFSSIGKMFGGVEGEAGGLMKTFHSLGGIVGIVSGAIKFVGTAIGSIFKGIGAVIGFVFKAFFAIIEGFMTVFEPVIDVCKELWGAVMEIGGVFEELWISFKISGAMIYEAFSPILDMFGSGGEGSGFLDGLKTVGKWLGYVAGFFIKFLVQPIILVAKVIGGLAKGLQAIIAFFRGDFTKSGELVKDAMLGILDAIIYPFKQIGTFLWDSTVAALSGLGELILDALMWPFKAVGDYILSWIPGGEAFAATEEENEKRVATDGAGMFSGMARTLGGMADFDIGKTLGGIGEAGSAALSAINPFNWFEEGTRKVEQTGLGVLHKNEMVVPAGAVDDISAKGNGSFASGGADPSSKAINTRMASQSTESTLDSAKFLYELHTLATTGKGLKVRTSGLDLSQMMIQAASPFDSISNFLGLDDFGPAAVTQASTASLPSTLTDADSELAQRTASTQPTTTEVVSQDLGDLTAESSEQTILMAQMVELLQKFVELAKPKSTISSSGGGEAGDTATRKATHPPANYYRAPIGHVSQTAGKAVLNVGSQTT